MREKDNDKRDMDSETQVLRKTETEILFTDSPNYPLTEEQLQECCSEMKPIVLVLALMRTYQSVEELYKLRSTENYPFSWQISHALGFSPDPPTFVLDALVCLSKKFDENESKEFTPRLEKMLGKIILDALDRYIYKLTNTSLTFSHKKKKRALSAILHEEDAIINRNLEILSTDYLDSSEKDHSDNHIDASASPEATRLSATRMSSLSQDFTRDGSSPAALLSDTIHKNLKVDILEKKVSSSGINTDEDIVNEEKYVSLSDNSTSMTDLQKLAKSSDSLDQLLIPTAKSWQDIISYDHQIRCLQLVMNICNPLFIPLLISVFHLEPFLIKPNSKNEHHGYNIIYRLLHEKRHHDAIGLIKKLNLSDLFSIEDLVTPMLESNDVQSVLQLVETNTTQRDELLAFVNQQLSFAFDADVIPEEMRKTISEEIMHTPPMKRIHDRHFQSNITNAMIRVLNQNHLNPLPLYPFIKFSNLFSYLRWVLNSRMAQQIEEQDFSIEASENYNGLIERLMEDCPSMQRLLIKELMQMEDKIAANHFAKLYELKDFMTKCEQSASRMPRKTITQLQKSRRRGYDRKYYYELPVEAIVRFVSTSVDLQEMQQTIQQSSICGIDTEWRPTFHGADGMHRTALMQIAFNVTPPIIYLLDMIVLQQTGPEGGLLEETQRILKNLFYEARIRKIGYEFYGDQELLGRSFPSLSPHNAPLNNFLDLKKVQLPLRKNEPKIAGGLSGLVTTYLKVALNKKQRLSNWERRPLTNDQKLYAASDSYSLLEIYKILVDEENPVLKQVVIISTTTEEK